MSQPHSLSEQVRAYASTHLAAASLSLVSDTNNLVFRIDRERGAPVALRVILDRDIDLEMSRDLERHLSDRVRFARTLDIDTRRDLIDHDVVICEWAPGRTMADLVAERGFEEEISEAYGDLGASMLRACEEISPPREGYGHYKIGRALSPTLSAFYTEAVERYAIRVAAVAPVLDGVDVARASQSLSRFLVAIGDNAPPRGVVPVDVNLKNFVCSDDGAITVLNVPMIARTTPSHGLAAFVFQARGRQRRDQIYRRLNGGTPSEDGTRSVSAFEAFYALGVLAYCARDGREAVEQSVAWGSQLTLREIFVTALREAELV
jgi:hypothetical protein